jgi:hypothetical protein
VSVEASFPIFMSLTWISMKPSFAPVIPKSRAEWLLSENNKTERKERKR